MIVFALVCALMLLIAIALIGRPLLKRSDDESYSKRLSVFILASLIMSLLASAVYVTNTNWSWQNLPTQADAAAASAQSAEIDALTKKVSSEPGNVENWKALGRAYVSGGNYALAGNAYQHAYELTKGQDVDVVTGLAEALVLTDQASLNGRVGVLIDEALQLQPNNPKALWYGGLVALQLENLPLARDRFKTLLAMNPPPQVRALLERQIQDLTQQLGESSSAGAKPVTAVSARKIMVKVTLAPALQQQLKTPMSLFVLARNPQQPGPPLAVERHLSSELPLQVELSADDAMLPTRTLASAADVEIVARLSASGMPTEQSGDYYGRAAYSFTKQGEQGSVAIEINQRVP